MSNRRVGFVRPTNDLAQSRSTLLSRIDEENRPSMDLAEAERLAMKSDSEDEILDHEEFMDGLIENRGAQRGRDTEFQNRQDLRAMQASFKDKSEADRRATERKQSDIGLSSDDEDSEEDKRMRKRMTKGLISLNQRGLIHSAVKDMEENGIMLEDSDDESNESLSSDDSSSDDDVDGRLKEISAKKQTLRLGTALRVAIYNKAGPITLVEINES